MRIRCKNSPESTRLEMASMIDVVFLLLIFFVMTFQVTAMEGDFAIAAPTFGKVGNEFVPLESVLHVRLQAAEDNRMSGVELDNKRFANVEELHAFVRRYVQDFESAGGMRAQLQVNLSCDANLAYSHTMDAITALRGYVDRDGDVVSLIKNVRLVPSRQ